MHAASAHLRLDHEDPPAPEVCHAVVDVQRPLTGQSVQHAVHHDERAGASDASAVESKARAPRLRQYYRVVVKCDVVILQIFTFEP